MSPPLDAMIVEGRVPCHEMGFDETTNTIVTRDRIPVQLLEATKCLRQITGERENQKHRYRFTRGDDTRINDTAPPWGMSGYTQGEYKKACRIINTAVHGRPELFEMVYHSTLGWGSTLR